MRKPKFRISPLLRRVTGREYRVYQNGQIEYRKPIVRDAIWIEKKPRLEKGSPVFEVVATGDRPRKFRVAKIVLDAFGRPGGPGEIIGYVDDDPTNVAIGNLVWKKRPISQRSLQQLRRTGGQQAREPTRSKEFVIRDGGERIDAENAEFFDRVRFAFVIEFISEITKYERNGKFRWRVSARGETADSKDLRSAVDELFSRFKGTKENEYSVAFRAYIRRIDDWKGRERLPK